MLLWAPRVMFRSDALDERKGLLPDPPLLWERVPAGNDCPWFRVRERLSV